jgi:hypothetical protein
MTDLLDSVLQAHGGLERWKTFREVKGTFVSGGGLFPMKGIEVDPNPLECTVTIHKESTLITPYARPDWRMRFTPKRVAIETLNGSLVEERLNPRDAYVGHGLSTHWDLFQRAYFNGYARWTYLTTPFFMAMPGFHVTEIEPWQEDAETWRGLRVRFPAGFESHSVEQELYFGEDFMLRGMTINWRLPVILLLRSMSTILSRSMVSGFRPNVEPT